MPAGVHSELNIKNLPSAHAMDVLKRVGRCPFPVQEVNQTVSRKLLQFGLITTEARPSPYKTHRKGIYRPFMVITERGLTALQALEEDGADGLKKLLSE